MIICNKHPRKYVVGHCALQDHLSAAVIDAQRHGEAAIVILIDTDDPTHFGVGYIGNETTSKPLQQCLRALGFASSN